MSISSEIKRLTDARNAIRAKGVELGISQSSDTFEKLALHFEGLENQGAVSANVKEGETYTIPKGYHNGSGTVSGVAGGGNYHLQSKTVTPTPRQQNVTPDSGFYGLSDVTVDAIPESYRDASGVTAQPADVLANRVFVDGSGTQAGTMLNNGAMLQTLDALTPSCTIPKGYHDGNGSVHVTLEEKSAVPSVDAQIITPTIGKLLSQVSIAPIPPTFAYTIDATATAADVLVGKTAYIGTLDDNGNAKAAQVCGAMANLGNITSHFDGLSATSIEIPAGYTSGGTISLTDDIEAALVVI